MNDHAPRFESDRVVVNVPEDLEIGDVVTMLNATDDDVGINAEIRYRYQETLVPRELREMFVLEEKTGIIRVGRKMDFEDQSSHVLYVEARDQGVNSVPVYATVVINVLDRNDNQPVIKVSFLDQESDVPVISEAAAVGSFVAFVSVTDRDRGDAGRVETSLQDSDDFLLETVDVNENR